MRGKISFRLIDKRFVTDTDAATRTKSLKFHGLLRNGSALLDGRIDSALISTGAFRSNTKSDMPSAVHRRCSIVYLDAFRECFYVRTIPGKTHPALLCQ